MFFFIKKRCKSGAVDGYRAQLCFSPETKVAAFSVTSNDKYHPKQLVLDSIDYIIEGLTKYYPKAILNFNLPAQPEKYFGRFTTNNPFSVEVFKENENSPLTAKISNSLFRLQFSFGLDYIENNKFQLKPISVVKENLDCMTYSELGIENEFVIFSEPDGNGFYQSLTLPSVLFDVYFRKDKTISISSKNNISILIIFLIYFLIFLN